MFDEKTASAVRATATFAFRHLDAATERERENILVALTVLLPESEAKIAQDALFHLRAQRQAQLELHALIDGIGGPQ